MIWPKILSTVGLGLDIAGAWIVAFDLVKTFSGAKYEHQRSIEEIMVRGLPKFYDGGPPEVTEKYMDWQKWLYKVRYRGLWLLTAGFLLQAIAVWLY